MLKEGDRFRWKFYCDENIPTEELEVVNGILTSVKGSTKGQKFNNYYPESEYWDYLGNFSKSRNFNSLYDKLCSTN